MLFDASVTLTLCVEFLSSWRVGNCCEASLHFHAELWCTNCTFDASIFLRIKTNYFVKRSQSRSTLEWVDMSGSVKKATLRFWIKFLAFSLKAVHFIKSVSRNNDCWVILWDAFEYVYLNDLCVQHIHIINIDWQVNWALDLTLFDIWCVGDSFGGFCLFFSHWIKFIATVKFCKIPEAIFVLYFLLHSARSCQSYSSSAFTRATYNIWKFDFDSKCCVNITKASFQKLNPALGSFGLILSHREERMNGWASHDPPFSFFPSFVA